MAKGLRLRAQAQESPTSMFRSIHGKVAFGIFLETRVRNNPVIYEKSPPTVLTFAVLTFEPPYFPLPPSSHPTFQHQRHPKATITNY